MARILIVEDEVVISRGIQYRLQNLGYGIAGKAYTGEEAVMLAEQTHPDLVLMDIHLAGEMDGIEAAGSIQAQNDIPVIYLTAYDDDEILQRAKLTKPFGFLLKPFDDANLRIAIEMALYKHKMELLSKQATNELKRRNARKNTFFSILAHDLHRSISSLHDANQSIVENFDASPPEKLKEIFLLQQASFENLRSLLDNLLTWTNVQQGMVKVQFQPLALGAIMAWHLQLLQPMAERKNILIQNFVPEQTQVFADQEMLYTVMHNLISNAVKYTEPGGTVTISAHQHQENVEISVSDTGVGINPEDLEKLFRIDIQFKRPGTNREIGTGLGLILCKEFMEQLGGTIRVDSQIGQGTTFTLTLPLPA